MDLSGAFELSSFITDLYAQTISYPIPLDESNTGHACNKWALYGTTFHAVTAAFATLGYYAQSEILFYMHLGFDKFAILLYTVAGIMGIVSMAFGQPPKYWLWFFIGPGIYQMTVETPAYAHGVGWMVGPYLQDQREVWRIAEAGAVNSGVARRGVITFDAVEGPGPADRGSVACRNPSHPSCQDGRVEVSQVFLVLDSFISDTVRQLSVWTGALSQVNPYQGGYGGSNSAALDSERTNVALEITAPAYMFGEQMDSGEYCEPDKKHYSTFTNSKWIYLNSITQAELTNTNARDAFARFIANECGDRLTNAFDFSNFVQATNYQNNGLPETVFIHEQIRNRGRGQNNSIRYQKLKSELGTTQVPTPTSLKRMLQEEKTTTAGGSFVRSVQWSPVSALSSNFECGEPAPRPSDKFFVEDILSKDQISCDTYLYLLLLYFRYEAGLIFSQAFQNGGPGSNDYINGSNTSSAIASWWPEDIAYHILYGWDIPFDQDCTAYNEGLSWQAQIQFVYNLILAHLFRNEMNRLPEIVSVGKDKTEAILDDSQLFNATIGSVSKAAEVFTWSLMIPYIQGILLYMLSLAFPIVCMLMLVPMWNKLIFTWMSFFVWVKLWDLGFAFVSSLERTLWAMMANTRSSGMVNAKVLEMSDYGGFNDPYLGNDLGCGFAPLAECRRNYGPDTVPVITLTDAPGGGLSEVASTGCPVRGGFGECLNLWDQSVAALPGREQFSAFDASLRIFDLSLIVSSALDLDLSNGYYIYIMSALYFAIPAVTGQLVLGAKSGVAGMVDKIAGDPAGKSASAAQSSYSGTEVSRIKQSGASVSQESMAKSHRASGLVDKALEQQNQAAMHGLHASHAGQEEAGSRRLADAVNLGNQTTMKARSAIGTGLKMAYAQSEAQRLQARARAGGPVDAVNLGNQSSLAGRGAGVGSPQTGTDSTEAAGVDGSRNLGAAPSSAVGPGDNQRTTVAPPPGPAARGGGSSGVSTGGSMGPDGRMRGGHNLLAAEAGAGMSLRQAGDGDRQVGGGRSMWKKAAGVAGGAADWAVDAAEPTAMAMYDYERTAMTTARQNQLTAQGGVAGIQGHYNSQMSSGMRSASERTMAQANFQAASDNYDAMNDFAQQRAGRFSVLGAPPGMLAPERRPEDAMGMAMTGMLDMPGAASGSTGRTARDKAQFFDNGMFRSQVQASRGNLNANFGLQKVTAEYQGAVQGMASSFVDSYGSLGRGAKELGISAANAVQAPPQATRSGDDATTKGKEKGST